MRDELERVRAWADAAMENEKLPGWAWYEIAKLRTDLDNVLTRVGPLVFPGEALQIEE